MTSKGRSSSRSVLYLTGKGGIRYAHNAAYQLPRFSVHEPNGILTLSSGTPFTISSGRDAGLNFNTTQPTKVDELQPVQYSDARLAAPAADRLVPPAISSPKIGRTS